MDAKSTDRQRCSQGALLTKCSLMLVSAAALAGCGLFQRDAKTQPEPESAVQAGNVFVSAYPAIAWEDISEQLEPKQNLTIEQARQLALQSTQSQVYQFLSTFAAGLALGLPARSFSETTSVAGDGTRTTTSSGSRGTGAVPASSSVASTAIDNAALAADLSKGGATLPSDANTLLTAAHALFQQAKILDNQISKAVVPRGYRAHLVTLQVNLQPLRRDTAYDAYVNISLMPGSWAESLASTKHYDADSPDFPPVVFYPLVITDALETANVGRSTEIIRQLSLSLSGVAGRVGANLGAGKGTDSLEGLVGTDKNSLITLGRVNDSTLRVRIGAQNAGTTRFAMVPRTYNVSVVVLTRNTDNKDRVKSLSVVTRTEFVSAKTGVALPVGPERDGRQLAERVDRIVSRYGLAVSNECGAGANPKADGRPFPQALSLRSLKVKRADGTEALAIGADEVFVEKNLQLLRAVDRGDYGEVHRCLDIDNELDTRRELGLRRMLAQLTDIQTTSRYATLQVPLRAIDDPALPPADQLVLARDDKTTMTMVLRGGKGLIGSSLTARLKVTASSPDNVLLPASLSVANGTDVVVTFPSLTAIGLAATNIADKGLEVKHSSFANPLSYRLQWFAEDKKPPGNPLRVDSMVVVSDGQGNGKLTLVTGKMPDGVRGQLRVMVSGADLREEKSIPTPAFGSKGVPLTVNSIVTLSLANLTPARSVTLTTYADDTKLGDINLPVERAVGVSK